MKKSIKLIQIFYIFFCEIFFFRKYFSLIFILFYGTLVNCILNFNFLTKLDEKP